MYNRFLTKAALCAVVAALSGATVLSGQSTIGKEVAVPRRLADGDEYKLSPNKLIDYGRSLFVANWTVQEGAGRPLSKGTGDPVADPTRPLVFPNNFNRVSGPDANSCAGCHNAPYAGGAGDIVGNVFVLGQRFDSASFDSSDATPTRGAIDERGRNATLQTIANFRATIGMNGAGFIEMLARQMTADLQAERDATLPGAATALKSKGVSFGTIARRADGSWDVSKVEGIGAFSLTTTGPNDPPSLAIRPFHQAGRVVSIREFTNNAFNHHHGLQSVERFGANTDPDGDGVRNEMNRADITAAVIFQATLPVPVQVQPATLEVQLAVVLGKDRFAKVGCGNCHVPELPLDKEGWIFTEPNPYNPAGNLRPGDAPTLRIDLTSDSLPQPRLKPNANGVVMVPAFTDLKLHDICENPQDPNIEPLDMQVKPGTDAFFAGNRKFITRKLWGSASLPSHYHHGQYTTMREAVLAHAGEALDSRQAFQALPAYEQDAVIEFLKTLQVSPHYSN